MFGFELNSHKWKILHVNQCSTAQFDWLNKVYEIKSIIILWYLWNGIHSTAISSHVSALNILFARIDYNESSCIIIMIWVWCAYAVYWIVNKCIHLKIITESATSCLSIAFWRIIFNWMRSNLVSRKLLTFLWRIKSVEVKFVLKLYQSIWAIG